MMQILLSSPRPNRLPRVLVSLVLYLGAILGGILLGMQAFPALVSTEFLASHLPFSASLEAKMAFGYGCFIRGAHVMIASVLAGIFGFFMREDSALRALTLTLPLWAPAIYMTLYILFSLR